MKRNKLNKEQIEKVYLEYAEIFNNLVGIGSKLTEGEKLQIIKQFKLGYKIAEHYWFYKETVEENDVFFIFAEKGLEGLLRIDKQIREQRRGKKRKS
jgi:hypothetical protein